MIDNTNGPRQYTFGEDIGKLYFKKNMSDEMDEEEDPEIAETRLRAQRILMKDTSMRKDNLFDDYWGKNKK